MRRKQIASVDVEKEFPVVWDVFMMLGVSPLHFVGECLYLAYVFCHNEFNLPAYDPKVQMLVAFEELERELIECPNFLT